MPQRPFHGAPEGAPVILHALTAKLPLAPEGAAKLAIKNIYRREAAVQPQSIGFTTFHVESVLKKYI